MCVCVCMFVKGVTKLRESNETEADAPAACLKAKTIGETDAETDISLSLCIMYVCIECVCVYASVLRTPVPLTLKNERLRTEHSGPDLVPLFVLGEDCR